MKRKNIVTGITYFFILLFMYTAISKLLAFDVTLFDMRRNPILGNMSLFWSVSVPVAEIIVSILLFVSATRLVGLWATLILIIGFTVYVGMLLVSNYQLPCTCGGIFRELSWTQHLYVNIGLTILVIIGILLSYGHGRNGKYIQTNEFIAQ